MSMLKDVYDIGICVEKEKMIAHAMKTIYFMWVMPNIGDYECFRKEIDEIVSKSKDPKYPKLDISIYITRSKEVLEHPFISGRPQISQIFQKMVINHRNKSGLVFACGPGPMVAELWDHSIQYTLNGT
eukprot:CAMPEP_0174822134 /NCGR_PEP_ID=MMETSP1107-20130205/13668_1 /TAXON_ID=36770 /ORGANISM="Paraphysomonas vestita, Strain GFlagA" /LENGTH=127 /DNA_ID=CAMNT_0016040255 /DNA_START=1264 /DNA_END=1643 /DNA_ORIENTATION=+